MLLTSRDTDCQDSHVHDHRPRVLIVDADRITATRLADRLTTQHNMLASATLALEPALDAAYESHPTIAVVDPMHLARCGLRIIDHLRAAIPSLPIIAYVERRPNAEQALLDAGADRVVFKDRDGVDVVAEAIITLRTTSQDTEGAS